MAGWQAHDLPLPALQRRLHLQEDSDDPHEVRLRQGAAIQVPLLRQTRQVLVQHLQTRAHEARRDARSSAQELMRPADDEKEARRLVLVRSSLEGFFGLLLLVSFLFKIVLVID